MRFVRLWRDWGSSQYWRDLLRSEFDGIGLIAVAAGLYDVLRPDDLDGFPIFAVPAAALIFALLREWPREVEESYARPKTAIRVVEGDLFAQDVHLVIGMTATFDTSVPDIIAPASVQAQFLTQVYGGNTADLDADLDAALATISTARTIVKPGKQDVFPLGTTVTIRKARRCYFCLAFTQMNERNEARATVDDLWISLSKLWDTVRAESNGEPIAIPVLGGGQSRLSQVLPAADSIRLIATSFLLASRREKVCDRLDIVVQKGAGVDLRELQVFLTGMKVG